MINYSDTKYIDRECCPYMFIGARYTKGNVEHNLPGEPIQIKRMHILRLNVKHRIILVFENMKVGERIYQVKTCEDRIDGTNTYMNHEYNWELEEIGRITYLKLITDLEDVIIIDEGRIVEIYHQLRHKEELILPSELILEFGRDYKS